MPYKFIQDLVLFRSEVAVMTVVSGQQAAVQPEPLLAEVLTYHLGQFEVNVVHIASQLFSTIFLFK